MICHQKYWKRFCILHLILYWIRVRQSLIRKEKGFRGICKVIQGGRCQVLNGRRRWVLVRWRILQAQAPPGADRPDKGGILIGRQTARIVPTGPCGSRGHRHPQGCGQLGQRQFRGAGSAAPLLDVTDERSRELSPAPQLCHRPPRQQATAAQLRPVADPVRAAPGPPLEFKPTVEKAPRPLKGCRGGGDRIRSTLGLGGPELCPPGALAVTRSVT